MPVVSTIGMRPLGKAALAVAELGFGSAPLGDLYEVLDDSTAIAAVTSAIDIGCTLIDTSPLYGHGLAEHRVGTALRRAGRSRIVLSTKVGRVLSPAKGTWDREGYKGGLPFSAKFDYSYDGAMRSLEQSFMRLGAAQVDIVLIHDLDRRNHGDALDGNFRQAVDGAYRALRRMRDEHVIKAIGLGVNETEVCVRMAQVCDIDTVLLAGRYTLLEQGALDDFLPLAEQRKIGVMLGGVFNSGILATGAAAVAHYDYAPAPAAIRDRVDRIEKICVRHGVPLAAAALQFPAVHPAVSSLVVGAVNPADVERNAATLRITVPDDLWAELKHEGLLRNDAPVPKPRP